MSSSPLWRRLLPAVVALSVLLFVALAMAALVFTPDWQRHQHQCNLIREINALGGSVRTEPAGPEWIRSLGAYEQAGKWGNVSIGIYDRIVEVRLNETGAGDDFLPKLAIWQHDLQSLNLSQCPITGAGLKHVARLEPLKDLDLSYTHVTDDDLAAIGSLTALERLDLSHNRISGRGFHRLAALDQLHTLCLVSTPIRDEALEKIVALPRLTTCNLFGCHHLSPQALDAFQTVRPHCRLFGIDTLKQQAHTDNQPIRQD